MRLVYDPTKYRISYIVEASEWEKERREGKWKKGEDDNNSKVPAVVGISFL